MHSTPLYVLLEGNDDERFFARVLLPILADEGYRVKTWKYAREKRKRTELFVRAVRESGAEYLFVRDIDTAPTIASKKREIRSWYHHAVSASRIVIVITEIESWYLAGIPGTTLQRFGISEAIESTESLTKEDFNRIVPDGMSRIHFMRELLARYDTGVAMEKNESFSYFMHRFAPRWLARDQGRLER
jgi:hypothetical protein